MNVYVYYIYIMLYNSITIITRLAVTDFNNMPAT